MRKIIGIVGLIGSGKNTLGRYLVDEHHFQSTSFAAALKDVLSTVFVWDRGLIEGSSVESREWRDTPDEWWENELNWRNQKFAMYFPRFTPRVCLQLFGTELFRNQFHNDIWLLSLKKRLFTHDENTVVTDCRFPNECKLITDFGGKIIRIRRGIDPEWATYVKNHLYTDGWLEKCIEYTSKKGIHISEWASLEWQEDYCIFNDSNVMALYESVNRFLEMSKVLA